MRKLLVAAVELLAVLLLRWTVFLLALPEAKVVLPANNNVFGMLVVSTAPVVDVAMSLHTNSPDFSQQAPHIQARIRDIVQSGATPGQPVQQTRQSSPRFVASTHSSDTPKCS